MDSQQQTHRRRRRRRARGVRRALRMLVPILLLVATILLSAGIVHVMERDVIFADPESALEDSLSAEAQQREWQRRYDDLLREYYAEDDSWGVEAEATKEPAAPSVGPLLKERAEMEEWMLELERFQFDPENSVR